MQSPEKELTLVMFDIYRRAKFEVSYNANLEITVEAVVVENPKWHSLFTPHEIDRARKRLKDYGYQPKI